ADYARARIDELKKKQAIAVTSPPPSTPLANTKEEPFELVGSGQSFTPSSPLSVGDSIQMMVSPGKRREIIGLFLCGEPCNTASKVTSWDTTELRRGANITFEVKRA